MRHAFNDLDDADRAPLTRFLLGHGFKAQATYWLESGKWWIYTGQFSDLVFGLSSAEFYRSSTFLITDPGGADRAPAAGTSLSNYVPDFFATACRAHEERMGWGESLVVAFGGHMPNALALFRHVRSQGRWLPLKADHAAVSSVA